MRQKELRIALVCYGGISLAVYMHGVTKELWKALKGSRQTWSNEPPVAEADDRPVRTEDVYVRLIEHLERAHSVKVRVVTDIVAGASAGGINSVLLAQAIYSGQSLEPLTDLWLERADVDVLLDPDARPGSRMAKFWASPLVTLMLHRSGNAVAESVAPETRDEVREKLSRLVRSRWFEPPFSGIGFSRLLAEALQSMEKRSEGNPLLPPGHPLDLFVTATDFRGHPEALRLHSPPVVLESEHRLTIGFHANAPRTAGASLAALPELVFAARATASFPGAFPPLKVGEIDELAEEIGEPWQSRGSFLGRIMPTHTRRGEVSDVALIDGSVLVNAPFGDAMNVLQNRPAHREVDRRFVYIDPTPDSSAYDGDRALSPGFFSVIFGSLSTIPREQPIRDNLESLEHRSREMATLAAIVEALRPEVEEAVDRLFGHTLFFDKPTAKRLSIWRSKSQAAAWQQAGFAYHGYAQIKFAGIVDSMARSVHEAAPQLDLGSPDPIAAHISAHLAENGLDRMSALRGGASPAAVEFFRSQDIAFRVRRLRLLARRVTQDHGEEGIDEDARDTARDVIYSALALYFDSEPITALGGTFPLIAARVFENPQGVIDQIAAARSLDLVDAKVDEMLASVLTGMPETLRRRVLLAYLGFPFYDTVTLPLLRGEGLTEFDPIKVDRISPDDCHAIASGPLGPLRGREFYNFGAFFSRAYRENDYLWGRLHGAERMIDLIASTLDRGNAMPVEILDRFKREAFLAILDEEEPRLQADPSLISSIRNRLA